VTGSDAHLPLPKVTSLWIKKKKRKYKRIVLRGAASKKEKKTEASFCVHSFGLCGQLGRKGRSSTPRVDTKERIRGDKKNEQPTILPISIVKTELQKRGGTIPWDT